MKFVFEYDKWLKAVLHHHFSYLVFLPEFDKIMASINNTIEGKVKNYNRVLKLRGKLEMILKQAMDKNCQTDLNQDSKKYLKEDSFDELNKKLDESIMPATNEYVDENMKWACEIPLRGYDPSSLWIWTLVDQ